MKNRRNLHTHTHTHTHTQIVLAGLILSIFNLGAYANDGLAVAIQNAKNACSGISDSMSDLKRRAGINTAITGVGTVTAGVALGTGIAKSGVDAEQQALIDKLIAEAEQTPIEKLEIVDREKFERDIMDAIEQASQKSADEQKIAELEQKSKTLGNIRTGTLAGTAVLDTAGTIIAANNRVDDDLQTKIDNCVKSVKNLSNEEIRARTENTATDAELATANKIITNCRDWEFVDLSPINKRATGAAVSSGAGAALAVIGAITSASANSDSVRHGDENKEKNLNTASNVLAGGATLGSGAATVFNATQISAIKKAADMADKCEGALK